MKVTAVPSAAGVPAEVIKAALMVVELAPSANSDVCPAVSVMPTTGLAAGGGVEGVKGDGVVLAGGVLGALAPGGDSWPCCPPPPAFWQPPMRLVPMRLNDTSSQPHACHPRLGRTYPYLLP